MSDTEERCFRLETKLAYMEDFMAKLQEIAVEHSDSIDRLKAENRVLKSRLEDLTENGRETPNTRPPHY